MKTDETRMMDNSQETQFMPQDNTALNANDSTVVEENDQQQEGENKSASKADSATIRRRAIYGAAGFAGGGIVGAAVSAMASGTPDKPLEAAATPDSEKTAEELAQANPEDPSAAPADTTEDPVIIEEQAPAAQQTAQAPAANTTAHATGRTTLLNPETHSAPVTPHQSPEQHVAHHTETPVEVNADEPIEVHPVAGAELAQNGVNVTVSVNIDGQNVEVTPVEPQVEVHSIGQIMDAEGNVLNHAEITVDGVNATLVDIDNNGTIDVAVVDADGDGVVSIDDAIDMSDTGLTMDDVSAHMMNHENPMADDQMAMNGDDFTPDMDPGF